MRIAVCTIESERACSIRNIPMHYNARTVYREARRADDKIYIATNLPFRAGNNSYNSHQFAEVSGFARARPHRIHKSLSNLAIYIYIYMYVSTRACHDLRSRRDY